jgi:hypothetical protein
MVFHRYIRKSLAAAQAVKDVHGYTPSATIFAQFSPSSGYKISMVGSEPLKIHP